MDIWRPCLLLNKCCSTNVLDTENATACSANPNSSQVQEKVTPRLTDNQSSAPVTVAGSCHHRAASLFLETLRPCIHPGCIGWSGPVLASWGQYWLVSIGQSRGYRSWYGEHRPDLKSRSHTLPSYKHMSSFPMKLRLKESDS